jgi:exodeoxyribonuclease VII small subunit
MTTADSGDTAISVTELSYTEASRELDDIVRFFEQRDVDVDQLVVRLERATAIVDELDRRVRKTRAQVEELVPRLEAVNRDVDAGSDEDDGDDLEGIGDPGGMSEGDDGDDQALF